MMMPTKNPMSVFSEENDIEEKIQTAVAKYDKRLLAWLGRLYKTLSKEAISEEELSDVLGMFEKIKKVSEKRYIENLVYPETAKDAKIPTSFPVPSSSFKLHASFSVTTNASGNVAGYVNPIFLGNAANTSFFINNDVSLTGASNSNFFIGVASNQNIPNNIYQRYRLVSYSIHVSYIGRWDIVSGVIGGGVTFDSGIGNNVAVGVVEPNGARYGNFDLIDDSYYAYRTAAINGIRIVYVPADPTFEEYVTTNQSVGGEQLHFYCQGLPPSTQCLRIDTYANFECLADPEFQNYIPTTVCTPAPEQVKEGTKILTANKDLVINSKKNFEEKEKPGFFSNLWSGIKNFYGGIMDVSKSIGGKVLPALIPGGSTLAKALPMLSGGLGGLVSTKSDFNSTLMDVD